MAKNSLTLSKDTTEMLAKHVKMLAENHRLDGALRNRFEVIDRTLQRETEKAVSALQQYRELHESGHKQLPDIELPLAFTQYDSALAYLASVFATGVPMFRVVSNKDLEEVASMMSALVGRDQSRFGWTGELLKVLSSVLKYNICAHEVTYAKKFGIKVETSLTDGESATGKTQAVLYEGNKFKALDMYNVFFDQSVLPSSVHEEGAFAGYIEQFNYIKLKTFLNGLDDQYKIMYNFKNVYKDAGHKTAFYYIPKIRQSDASGATGTNTNWADFFGLKSHNRSSGDYEVITCYSRIIPVEFSMQVPSKGTPQVWKIILVNGLCVYAEPVVAGHEYLPIIFGQAYDEGFGLQTKSFTENVLPFQELGSGIINGTISAMRRNITDRGLYNPAMINPKDINSRSSVAKIPVKVNKYFSNFSQAYMPLDFRDTITPQFTQNLGLVMGLADQVTGVNQATQGNFVKGNKTLFEFDTTMQNANARLQLMAIHFENSFMFPTKQIIKINYLLFARDEDLIDADSQTAVHIDPVQLRERSPEFKMADGLIPATKLGNTEVLMASLNFMGQIPELMMEYKMGEIALSVLRQQGFDDLHKYKRTPEEQQMYMQQMQAAAQQGEQPNE